MANQAAPEGAGVRINVGCGAKVWPGFINIDFPGNWSGKKPDIECDIRKLPFEAGYADEIHAIHVVEHLYRYEVEEVLKGWVKVLKPGGKLVVEVPCLDKILALFTMNPIQLRLTLWGLFGDPSYHDPHQVHKWCYCKGEMASLLGRVGLVAHEEDPQYHVKIRDMRFVGEKPL